MKSPSWTLRSYHCPEFLGKGWHQQERARPPPHWYAGWHRETRRDAYTVVVVNIGCECLHKTGVQYWFVIGYLGVVCLEVCRNKLEGTKKEINISPFSLRNYSNWLEQLY